MFLENNPVFFSGSKSEKMFSFSQRRFPSKFQSEFQWILRELRTSECARPALGQEARNKSVHTLGLRPFPCLSAGSVRTLAGRPVGCVRCCSAVTRPLFDMIREPAAKRQRPEQGFYTEHAGGRDAEDSDLAFKSMSKQEIGTSTLARVNIHCPHPGFLCAACSLLHALTLFYCAASARRTGIDLKGATFSIKRRNAEGPCPHFIDKCPVLPPFLGAVLVPDREVFSCASCAVNGGFPA